MLMEQCALLKSYDTAKLQESVNGLVYMYDAAATRAATAASAARKRRRNGGSAAFAAKEAGGTKLPPPGSARHERGAVESAEARKRESPRCVM